jgi:hypothetical protein
MEYIGDITSETVDEDDYEERMESLYSELSYLSEHPYELNQVTAEQLQRLPFLSDSQIEAILLHRKRYGPVVTVYELKNIEELDFQTIELLLPFVYIGNKTVDKRPLTVDNFVNYGKSELQIRYDQCFQQKEGYRPQSDSISAKYPNRRYTGEPFYNSFKYTYSFDERLQAGMVAEKDAGEPMWNKHNKGYDFYSFHILLKDLGWLKTLAAGDYKVSFGQGLVISNDFTPGRNVMITQAERRTHGFRRHFSTNENDFFRGIAATARWKDVDLSVFYSYKRQDATMTDSLTASTIKTDGLHRLMREREKTGLLPMQTFGGNIRYATPGVCLGVTALRYSFGEYRIMPDAKPYNLFYFRGSDNINVSADYLFKNRYLKFYGETAFSANKAPATLNALQMTPASYVSFLILHRYYAEKYQAYFGNAFSQNTMVQNEEGLYMGMGITPFAHWRVSAYADVFRFPWLRYGVDAPSTGKEYMIQVDHTKTKGASFYLRYKYRQREKNQTLPGGETSVLPYEQHRARMQVVYALQSFNFKTSLDGVIYSTETAQSNGLMIAQSIEWKPTPLPLQASLHLAYFHTDDYNSRLSSYEKNILHAFTMPQLYGKGLRLSATVRHDISSNLALFAKLSHTYHSDMDVTGAGPEEIKGNLKTDISVIIRCKV